MEEQLPQLVESIKAIIEVWGQVVLAASIIVKYLIPEIKEGGFKTIVKLIGRFVALNR